MSTQNTTSNIEETTAFQDPPTILVLRRKAIRMFGRGQSVATYRNDNLNIDVAIPYKPGTLGKTQIKVATAEEVTEAMSPELKKLRKERGIFKRDLSRQEDRFETTKQRLDWAKRALAGHIKKHGKTLDPIGEEVISELSKKVLKNYVHKASADLKTKKTFDFKRLNREAGVDQAKDKIKESVGLHTPEQIKDYEKHPENYKRDQNAKILKYFRDKGRKIDMPTPVKEDSMMEATIHSLHTITKTQHPANIRFRDGSSAMIDHPTAAQIMKLHSKVNRLNKKKIEGLINSGPTGIKKVSSFIKDHMK